jgi:hypothetical protein
LKKKKKKTEKQKNKTPNWDLFSLSPAPITLLLLLLRCQSWLLLSHLPLSVLPFLPPFNVLSLPSLRETPPYQDLKES